MTTARRPIYATFAAASAIAFIVLLNAAAVIAPAQEGGGSDLGFDPFAVDFPTAAGTATAADAPGGEFSADDPFAGFDAQAGSGEIAKTEYLAGGSVAADLSARGAAGKDGYAAAAGITGKLFAKVSIPDFGSLYLSYLGSYFPFRSAVGAYAATATPAAAEPVWNMAELHYSFDIAKTLFVRLGNQLIAWGPSRIWTPVDFINLQKADAFAALDARVGKPGLRLHLPLGAANIFAFADFYALSRTPADTDPAKTVNLGLRADLTAGGAEFGFSVYGGQRSQLKLGADFSGRLLGASVYGEAAFAPAYEAWSRNWDASWQAAVGISRSLDELKLWTVSMEGYYDSRGGDYTDTAVPADRNRPLYQGAAYLYGALQAAELFHPDLATTFSLIMNLSDLSYNLKLSESVSLPGAPPFSLGLNWYGGGDGKEFTRYNGDNAFSVSLTVRMEF